MSKLLALDQASHITGWAIFEDDQLKEWGKFSVDDKDIGDRLYKIRNFVKETIETKNIDKLVFEDIQLQTNVQNNVKAFKILAEVFGVIYELATEMKIPNQAILSGTWKSTLGIEGKNRQEQKRNAKAWAQDTYGIKCTQDEADAICIGSHIIKKGFTGEEDSDSYSWD